MKSRREVVQLYYPNMKTDPNSPFMQCPGDAIEGLPRAFDDVCPMIRESGAYASCERCWAAEYKNEPVMAKALVIKVVEEEARVFEEEAKVF